MSFETRVPAVKWLQQFLRKESSGIRLALGLAVAGHIIIALLLMLGAFERTDAASVVAIPVEIVVEKPDAPAPQGQQPSPAASAPNEPNEQNPWQSVPTVADVDKHAKAPLATLDVNGIDLPKPGHDGGDPKRDTAGSPLPPADGELASGAESTPSWAMHVAPIGPAPPQTTAREPGEDEMTAIEEQKIQCGAKAMRPSPMAPIRNKARVLGTASGDQTLAMIRSTQVVADRHINPQYLRSQRVFAETLDGAAKFTVVLPTGLAVNEGDVIEVDLGYVDPSNPCQYIPNVAVGKL